MLPLWQGVVFVDWNGVLNDEPFWSSIRKNPDHPAHDILGAACSRLFKHDDDTVEAWMRGQLQSQEIVARLGIRLDRRYRPDYLVRRLRSDCERMSCEPKLLAALREIRRSALVVLATDNMDCFTGALHRIMDLHGVADFVISSSEVGVLKAENVQIFFGNWLRDHRLTFSEAILLDDSPRNCAAFCAAGGEAVLVKSPDDAVAGLRAWRERRGS